MSHPQLNLDPLLTVLNEHRKKLDRFAELLIAENKKVNLTRIDSPQEIQTRHFLDSLAGLSILDELSQKIQKPLRVLDIGSGAGFPSLVIAMIRPAWKIVSLEATEKKVRFQKKVCEALELNNATILHGRAEAFAHDVKFRQTFDAVTARALAAMPILAELTLGLVRTGGAGLYWKGPAINEELEIAQAAVKQMGAKIEDVLSYTLPSADQESPNLSLVVCRKIKSTPKPYPRVFGVIKKQPLS